MHVSVSEPRDAFTSAGKILPLLFLCNNFLVSSSHISFYLLSFKKAIMYIWSGFFKCMEKWGRTNIFQKKSFLWPFSIKSLISITCIQNCPQYLWNNVLYGNISNKIIFCDMVKELCGLSHLHFKVYLRLFRETVTILPCIVINWVMSNSPLDCLSKNEWRSILLTSKSATCLHLIDS